MPSTRWSSASDDDNSSRCLWGQETKTRGTHASAHYTSRTSWNVAASELSTNTIFNTSRAALQHQPCVNGDWRCQWEMANSDPPQNPHSLTDHQKIWYRWLCRWQPWQSQIWWKSVHGGFWANGWNITNATAKIMKKWYNGTDHLPVIVASDRPRTTLSTRAH